MSISILDILEIAPPFAPAAKRKMRGDGTVGRHVDFRDHLKPLSAEERARLRREMEMADDNFLFAVVL